MKFGRHLKTSLVREYQYQYFDYDAVKKEIKKGTTNGRKWTEDDEAAFVSLLEAELDKVHTFQKVKSGEIGRRVKATEKDIDQVVKELNNETEPPEETFLILEEEVSDIIADVHDLAHYTRLNYTAFQKILKKHDKKTTFILKPIFAARLNAKPFYKENYDALVVKLSKQYDFVRTRGNPVKGDSSAGGSQQNFVRNTTKYWVHPDNITELKLIILKHLPVLVFNPNKEFEPADSAISSIYYDNKELELYLGRLEKSEGAEAVRMRWYGDVTNTTIFVERKTHREDWTGEKSVKARFSIKEKLLNGYLKGEVPIEAIFEKARKEGKMGAKEIADLEALAREVQYAVISQRLKPAIRSFYNRTAFQLPGDARVRISLDTELSLIREDSFDGHPRAGENWRRTDIGIDYPFNQLPDSDICRFPYAVLEVKLQTQLGQEAPRWVRELVSSHLVEAVPKFSKFIHGAATLLYDKVELLPFWYMQMSTDIRKPKSSSAVGIQRVRDSTTVSTSASSDMSRGGGGNDMDEEEAAGDDYSPERGFPLDEDEDGDRQYVFHEDQLEHIEEGPRRRRGLAEDEDDFEDSDSDDEHHHRRTMRERLNRVWKWTKKFIMPTPSATAATLENPQAALAGPQFTRTFKAPPGKRIAVPVRVEPKVYFANERCLLSWYEAGIVLGAIAAGLLNFGDDVAIKAAFGFTFVAIALVMYAMGMFLWRAAMIRKRRAVRYDDRLGPTVLCALLFIAVGANFILRYLNADEDEDENAFLVVQ